MMDKDRSATEPSEITGSTIAIPVSESNPALRDVFPAIIGDLYAKTMKQGLMGRVFPGNDMSYALFTQYVAHPAGHLVIGKLEGLIGQAIAGYGWLYQQNGTGTEKNGVVGLCFFREFWGKKELGDLAQQTIAYWFSCGFKVLYSTVLQSNSAARRFAVQNGWERVGYLKDYFLISGALQDGVMYSLSRPR